MNVETLLQIICLKIAFELTVENTVLQLLLEYCMKRSSEMYYLIILVTTPHSLCNIG